jgi:Conserved TM helix
MTHIFNGLNSLPLNLFLAQARDNFATQNIFSELGTNFGESLLNLLKGLIILIIGWIISGIVKNVVKRLLNATNFDNRIASWVTGQRGESTFPIEEWIANIFCWLVRLFAIVAFLNALNLQGVSAPLNSLLTRVTNFIPQLVGAAILLGIAWVVATLVKTIATRSLSTFNLDRKLGSTMGDRSDFALSETIGNALYWFIFLLFLPAVLSTLELDGTLSPIQGMLDKLLAMLPNILGAVILGVVGWFISQIVSRLVTNLLAAAGADEIGERFGLRAIEGQKPLSGIIGTIVFVLILIPFAISALEALKIAAISDPATDMLQQVFDLLPKIFSAGLVLAFFYAAGRFVADLITNVLTSVGFNNFLEWLGIYASPTETTLDPTYPIDTEQATVLQTESFGSKTPSEYVGVIALVGIMLVGTLSAVDILGIPALEAVIGEIMRIAGQVLVAVLFFGIGLYFANLAYKLIASSGTSQAGFLAQSTRIAILALVGAMALNRIGVAPDIVNLAFGLLLGGIAVAIALAFGLGGREVAKETLRSWVNSFKNE